jgi:hypothetical protein
MLKVELTPCLLNRYLRCSPFFETPSESNFVQQEATPRWGRPVIGRAEEPRFSFVSCFVSQRCHPHPCRAVSEEVVLAPARGRNVRETRVKTAALCCSLSLAVAPL